MKLGRMSILILVDCKIDKNYLVGTRYTTKIPPLCILFVLHYDLCHSISFCILHFDYGIISWCSPIGWLVVAPVVDVALLNLSQSIFDHKTVVTNVSMPVFFFF